MPNPLKAGREHFKVSVQLRNAHAEQKGPNIEGKNNFVREMIKSFHGIHRELYKEIKC